MSGGGSVYTMRDVFSPEECRTLIERCNALELTEGPIRAGEDYRELVVDPSYRRVHLAKLGYDEPHRWIHDRLLGAVREVNQALRFELQPRLTEPVQFLRYGVGGHYKAHTDSNKGVIAGRRLSVIVQLSAPTDYRGGQVEFLEQACHAATEQGSATFFPSYLMHQVHPLEEGERYALVAWVWGL